LISVTNNAEDKILRAEIILLDINTLKQVSDYKYKQVPNSSFDPREEILINRPLRLELRQIRGGKKKEKSFYERTSEKKANKESFPAMLPPPLILFSIAMTKAYSKGWL